MRRLAAVVLLAPMSPAAANVNPPAAACTAGHASASASARCRRSRLAPGGWHAPSEDQRGQQYGGPACAAVHDSTLTVTPTGPAPLRRAQAAASTRLDVPVLRSRFDTWTLTVFSLMNSAAAISP